MLRRGVALSLVLGIASVANAGAVVELTALTPENGVGGYLPGTSVEFQAAISRTDAGGGAFLVRLLTLGFGASSPELTFTGPDNFPVIPGPDGIEEFVFDLSSLAGDFLYGQFPNYSAPNLTNTGTTPVPGFFLQVPGTGGGSLVVGTGTVILPAALGTYSVDALDAANTNNNRTARVDFDFANPQSWLANGTGDDLITGEDLSLTVVPEPATLALLGLGGIAALRRRRKA